MDVRLLEPGDEGVMVGYDKDAFDAEVTPAQLTAYLAAPLHKMAVAVVDGVVVGQARAVLHVQPDEPLGLYLDNLGVAETHKRKGLATAMVAALKRWGQAKGAQSFWVATESDNEEGLGFYRALGLKGEGMTYFEDSF